MSAGIARAVGLSAVVVFAAFLCGCASFEGYAREPESTGVINAERVRFYSANSDEIYYRANDPVSRKAIRDYLIYGKMEVIESDFDDLERELNGTGNSVSVFGDLAVLGLNGYSAVGGTKGTKAALSAASAGIVGAQGAISKDLYYQRTLPAILSQMEASREAVRAEIIASLGKSDADYPLPAAEVDLKRLVRAGSIPSSISGITEGANQSKQISEQAIATLRNASFGNGPSENRLAGWLRPNGKVDPARTKAFQDWIKAQPDADFLTSLPFETIVRSPDTVMESVRQRALADPTLAIPK